MATNDETRAAEAQQIIDGITKRETETGTEYAANNPDAFLFGLREPYELARAYLSHRDELSRLRAVNAELVSELRKASVELNPAELVAHNVALDLFSEQDVKDSLLAACSRIDAALTRHGAGKGSGA